MKKLFAILCALACLAMLFIPAMAAFDTVESLAVVGSGIPGVGEWKPEDPAGDMTEVSDGIWEKTLELTAGTSMKFKVAGNDTWDDTCNFGSATIVLGEKADLTCSGMSSDMPFTAEKDMTVKITVDLTGDTATILVAEVTDGGDEPVAPPAEDPTEPTEEPTTEPTTEAPAEDEDPTEAPSEGESEEEATKPTTPAKKAMTAAERKAARMKVYIVLGIALVVIIGIACILSIPKKLN